jgi:2-keto-4-pentenoate hydratase
MSAAELDPRIVRGMQEQLRGRSERIAAGERPIGWKVGFGSPAGMQALGIDRPLVGFLMEAGVIEPGAEVSVTGWVKPAFEPEIAVQLGADVPADARREDVEAAIAGLAAAIELADVDAPPETPESILAGNIFHRHVAFGPVDASRRAAGGIPVAVTVGGEEVAASTDSQALTGEIVEVVRLTAGLLGSAGELLRAGDLIITGSMVPPLFVAAGDDIAADFGPLGSLGVRLR